MIKHTILYHALSKWAPIPEGEWWELTQHLESFTFKKGDLLVRAGEVAKDIGFILSGYCRQYFTHDNGQEFNHYFNFENELVSGYVSHLTGKVCPYSIQAMTDGELLTMPYAKYETF